jgi:hypothetical protein
MVEAAIEEHGVVETLDAVESLYLDSLRNEAARFRLAAHFADLSSVESPRSREGRVLPGTERLVTLGGQGTPRVCEFAPAMFGARMQMSPFGARCYLADALDTRHRLPRLWARVVAGEVRIGFVRHVAQQTRHLSAAAAGTVDAAVAEYADGRIGYGRFTTKVAAAVVRADPEAAAAKEAEAAQRQFAKASRSSEHGMRGFYLRSTVGVVAQLDAVVAFYAEVLKTLGDTDPEDLRRVKACLVMANPLHAVELLQAFAGHRAAQDAAGAADRREDDDAPLPTLDAGAPDDAEPEPDPEPEPQPEDPPDGLGPTCPSCGAGAAGPVALMRPRRFRPDAVTPDPASPGYAAGASGRYAPDYSRLLPRVRLFLHLSEESIEGDLDGVARWEGVGPISPTYVRDVLGLHHRFTITPVLDLADQAPVDAYEIPERHRTAVHLRTPADCFPYASNLSADKDIDHTRPYQPPERGGGPGQSNLGNYGPMTRFHHRIKTAGSWQVRQPFPGIYVWRDEVGHFYLVDHTGTRKITQPADARAS